MLTDATRLGQVHRVAADRLIQEKRHGAAILNQLHLPALLYTTSSERRRELCLQISKLPKINNNGTFVVFI